MFWNTVSNEDDGGSTQLYHSCFLNQNRHLWPDLISFSVKGACIFHCLSKYMCLTPNAVINEVINAALMGECFTSVLVFDNKVCSFFNANVERNLLVSYRGRGYPWNLKIILALSIWANEKFYYRHSFKKSVSLQMWWSNKNF